MHIEISKSAIYVRMHGPSAEFVDPAFKAERITYPFATVSALRGGLRSIYGKPEIELVIPRFAICKPIVTGCEGVTELKRNGSGK